MNVYNNRNRLRYREQTRGEGGCKGQDRGMGLRDTNQCV